MEKLIHRVIANSLLSYTEKIAVGANALIDLAGMLSILEGIAKFLAGIANFICRC